MAMMGLLQTLWPAFRQAALSESGELMANARTEHPALVTASTHQP